MLIGRRKIMRKAKNQEPGIATKIFMCVLSLGLAIYVFATQTDLVFLKEIPLPYWLMGSLFALSGILFGWDSWKTLKKKKAK